MLVVYTVYNIMDSIMYANWLNFALKAFQAAYKGWKL